MLLIYCQAWFTSKVASCRKARATDVSANSSQDVVRIDNIRAIFAAHGLYVCHWCMQEVLDEDGQPAGQKVADEEGGVAHRNSVHFVGHRAMDAENALVRFRDFRGIAMRSFFRGTLTGLMSRLGEAKQFDDRMQGDAAAVRLL